MKKLLLHDIFESPWGFIIFFVVLIWVVSLNGMALVWLGKTLLGGQ